LESLYLLIPIALIFIIIVAALLIWSINRGQYDDLDNDAWRALNDDLSSKSAPKGDNDRN
jgi:cbb3-type cytochrome oxidase maturation protein